MPTTGAEQTSMNFSVYSTSWFFSEGQMVRSIIQALVQANGRFLLGQSLYRLIDSAEDLVFLPAADDSGKGLGRDPRNSTVAPVERGT